MNTVYATEYDFMINSSDFVPLHCKISQTLERTLIYNPDYHGHTSVFFQQYKISQFSYT